MTDNEIIKAFEHLVKNANNHIPITSKMLLEDVLGVLNRQKAEIEQYKIVNILIAQQRDERDKDIVELEAEIEKYEQIKTTINEFWDILLKHSIAKRKESPTLEELADGIHEIEVNAIKEFSSRIESMLSMHPAQRRYYEKIKKEFIKENENDK